MNWTTHQVRISGQVLPSFASCHIGKEEEEEYKEIERGRETLEFKLHMQQKEKYLLPSASCHAHHTY